MRRLAIYPGSFDPLTFGHMDVIERSAKLFDQVIVAVGANSAKKPLLTTDARVKAIRESVAGIPNVSVDSFSGLLVDFVLAQGATVVIRGLRATADFEYEFQMATVNRKLTGNLETLFLMTKWEHSYLSSTIVKELARLGGDYSSFVPEPVARVIADSLKRAP
jgi:pantetheine-phosphate adenylyltransferase